MTEPESTSVALSLFDLHVGVKSPETGQVASQVQPIWARATFPIQLGAFTEEKVPS
jgi:hypothetical protein